MDKNSVDLQEVMRIAKSPAGQQLIAMLKEKDPTALQQAAKQASHGNYAQAMDRLKDILSSPEGQRLLKDLGR
ncbi:MAG: hypothetical protein IKW10_08140 [Oscillospiraceae bacterium]|nr:hypothetical protein [Oscillospiraceae bacterium]